MEITTQTSRRRQWPFLAACLRDAWECPWFVWRGNKEHRETAVFSMWRSGHYVTQRHMSSFAASSSCECIWLDSGVQHTIFQACVVFTSQLPGLPGPGCTLLSLFCFGSCFLFSTRDVLTPHLYNLQRTNGSCASSDKRKRLHLSCCKSFHSTAMVWV